MRALILNSQVGRGSIAKGNQSQGSGYFSVQNVHIYVYHVYVYMYNHTCICLHFVSIYIHT